MKVKTKEANSARVISERAINDTLADRRVALSGFQIAEADRYMKGA